MNHLQLGLHLKVSRGVYTHHGIYIGDNQIIHYSGFAEAFKKGAIEQTNLESFLGGVDDFKVVNYPSYQNIYSPEEIVHRAQSCLGEDDYNLFFNNCEHFACWCVTGCARSDQVRSVMENVTTVASHYSLIKDLLLTNIPKHALTTVATQTTQRALVSGLISGSGAVATTSLIGGGAMATGLAGASIAAAPVVVPAIVIGALVGGLFSLFDD